VAVQEPRREAFDESITTPKFGKFVRLSANLHQIPWKNSPQIIWKVTRADLGGPNSALHNAEHF
jgi:hypothetical protein